MKRFKVWIYDEESGCNQPIVCEADSVAGAKACGQWYIKTRGLVGAEITDIAEITKIIEVTNDEAV